MSAALHTAFNEQKTLRQWSEDERCAVSLGTLHRRISRAWTAEKAITQPNTVTDQMPERIVLTPPVRFTNFCMPAGSYVPPRWGEALGNRMVA